MISLKTARDVSYIRKAGRIAAKTLVLLKKSSRHGINTAFLDKLAEQYIRKNGGIPAFKGYNGYPATACISLNEQIVHGIPRETTYLKNGDLVSIDVGVNYDGYFADTAISFCIGPSSGKTKHLIKTTKDALMAGIKYAKPGNRLYDISSAIQIVAEKNGYSVIRDLVGHGVGYKVHEPPEVPNYGKSGTGPELKTGMVLAIEPMLSMGTYQIKILDDNWTAVTCDGSLAAHFEHTVYIGRNKAEILTR